MSTERSPGLSGEPATAKPPLALIAGPTASGKSDIAVEFAARLERRGKRAVIINADSAQVYRDLSVLSARPKPEDMRGIEHHLFGAWDGAAPCSAADWARHASEQIAECHGSGAYPILVGGSGLYVRTLLDGIAPIPEIDPKIRAAVRAMAVEKAYAALQAEDAERAARLSPADAARIARALEVVRSTGQPLASWQSRLEGGIGAQVDLFAAVLLPEREALYARCNARFAEMIDRGAVDEVRSLLARGLDQELPVMRAIGVAEIAGFLGGEISLEEASVRAAQATRNYAKRQYTWFRRQSPDGWPRIKFDDFTISTICDRLFHEFRLT